MPGVIAVMSSILIFRVSGVVVGNRVLRQTYCNTKFSLQDVGAIERRNVSVIVDPPVIINFIRILTIRILQQEMLIFTGHCYVLFTSEDPKKLCIL